MHKVRLQVKGRRKIVLLLLLDLLEKFSRKKVKWIQIKPSQGEYVNYLLSQKQYTLAEPAS